MRNALRSNHVSEGILIKSISFDSLFFYFKSKFSKIRLGLNPGFGLELEVMKIARMGRPTLKTSRSPKISRSISTYLD